MMNKEKILLDFSMFILSDVEELCSLVTDFFGQIKRNELPFEFKLLDYEEYIREEILVEEILVDYNLKSEIKSINDFLSSEELYNFREYLNNNFRDGFPDGDEDGSYGGNSPLELKNADLNKYFDRYLRLRQINQNVFITYYIQLFDSLNGNVIEKLKTETDKIQNIADTKDLLFIDLSKEFVEDRRKKYKEKLFDSVENNIFQFKGFADEKGLYFDVKNTLNDYLAYLKTNEIIDIRYSTNFPVIDNSLDYLLYQFFEYKVLDINHFKNRFSTEKEEILSGVLHTLKKENSDLIKYLSIKNFSSQEIDIIFNVLSDNKFSKLRIRDLNINKQVEFFNFCYLFYILDYYTEKQDTDFNKEASFDILLNFSSERQNEFDKNMFAKYYKNISGSRQKHNPFGKIDILLKNIETQLGIKINSLKSLTI